jgi:hypothetical protein
VDCKRSSGSNVSNLGIAVKELERGVGTLVAGSGLIGGEGPA